MAVNKVVYNNNTLIDISDTTAVATDVAQGKIFYGANGEQITGTNTGGGGSSPVAAEEKTVEFIDYDGTLLYSYTPTEFAALTEMPANPSHTGLIAQGWNWSLAAAKSCVSECGGVTIGQTYITDDGKTRIYIEIPEDADSSHFVFYVRYTQSVSQGVTVNWGDGVSETFTGTAAANREHTYSACGKYTITLEATSGTIQFVGSSSTQAIYGPTGNEYMANRHRIKAVEFGENIRSIGSSVFRYCYDIEYITFPNYVIGVANSSYTFSDCRSLKGIVIPSGFNLPTYAFNYCVDLKRVSLGEKTQIRANSFQYCYNLEKIIIGTSTNTIAASTFTHCDILQKIVFPSNVTSIGTSAFTSCGKLEEIIIKSSSISFGSSAFHSCASLKKIVFNGSVTSIESSAFQSCTGLTDISFTGITNAIGNSAFNGCKALKSISLKGSFTSIGTSVFSGATSLDSIDIPNTVTSIGNEAFRGTAIQQFTLPSSLTSIGNKVFYACSSLKNVVFPKNMSVVLSETFVTDYSLESIEIPNGVTSISADFNGCYYLKSVTIPNTVTTIGDNTFQNCNAISELTIPSGVTSIGAYAFRYCYCLEALHMLPEIPPTLGTTPFANSVFPIYVPYSADHSILNAYQNETGWTAYASRIMEEPQ